MKTQQYARLMPVLLIAAVVFGVTWFVPGFAEPLTAYGQWTALAPTNPDGLTVRSIALDPTDSRVVYAGTDDGWVFKSMDLGVTWAATQIPHTTVASIEWLAIDEWNGQNVYVCGFFGWPAVGIYQSTDGGASWSLPSSELQECYKLVINPMMPQTMYAGTTSQFYKSFDGGLSWVKLPVPDGGTIHATAPAIAPNTGQTIYLGSESPNAIFKSTDGGGFWVQVFTSPAPVHMLAIDRFDPQVLYAGTGGSGILKSTDGGATWHAANYGLTKLNIHALAIDPSQSQIVYAGAIASSGLSGGLFKSTDGGATWHEIGFGVTNADVYALAVDYTGTVYIGTNHGLFKLGSAQAVDIDINPGSDANTVNCTQPNALIPVAILTTDTFDATSVDHTTVLFAGASESHINRKSGQPLRHEEDVDNDGDRDLIFHFRLGNTALTCTSTQATLTGYTFAGWAITGSDSVYMVRQARDRGEAAAAEGSFFLYLPLISQDE
ncbi:MAG: hypothetical protein DYG89_29095 [Caldilinea sp. CFX5]|nr:hypothetical protein [Caldilinea sp. CFX5]